MLEKIVELLASIASSLATIASNGGVATTLTQGTVSAPAADTPAAGEPAKKRGPGRPAGSTPAAPAASTPAATAVTLDEIKSVVNPWLSGDQAKRAERGAAVNKVLDGFRSSPSEGLADIPATNYPAIFAELKKLVEADKPAAAANLDNFSL